MHYKTPSRFRPTGPWTASVLRRSVGALAVAWRDTAIAATEWALFTSFPGVALRPLAARKMRRRVERIQHLFDNDFYLRQFNDPARRARIARAPVLHYALVGWREFRSPTPAFDPTFYFHSNPLLREDTDPFLHCLERAHDSSGTFNEVGSTQTWLADAPTILSVNHGRGGGSSRFLDLAEEDWRKRGYNVLRLRAVRGTASLGVIDNERHAIVFDLANQDAIVSFARQRRVERILVNHVIDRPPAFPGWLESLSQRIGRPFDIVLHDYFALCPRVNLVTGAGRFCDVPAPAACVHCVAADGSEVRDIDIESWRASSLRFVAKADAVIVPSDDVVLRMKQHLNRAYRVWPPEDDTGLRQEQIPGLRSDEPLRVVTLGALNIPKGAHVLAALAREARNAAPISFSVLGPSPETSRLKAAGVSVSGAYRPEELDRLIETARPHVVFLPAIWPETWSFVLTEALRRGLPVVAFDIGAPAERLRRLGRGHLLPLALSERPADLLTAFRALREHWVLR